MVVQELQNISDKSRLLQKEIDEAEAMLEIDLITRELKNPLSDEEKQKWENTLTAKKIEKKENDDKLLRVVETYKHHG
jgi:hypothetical protein